MCVIFDGIKLILAVSQLLLRTDTIPYRPIFIYTRLYYYFPRIHFDDDGILHFQSYTKLSVHHDSRCLCSSETSLASPITRWWIDSIPAVIRVSLFIYYLFNSEREWKWLEWVEVTYSVSFFPVIMAACVKVDPEFPTRESFEHPLLYSTFRICSVELRAPMLSTNWDLTSRGQEEEFDDTFLFLSCFRSHIK